MGPKTIAGKQWQPGPPVSRHFRHLEDYLPGDSFVNAFRLPGCVNTSVSNRPIWLVEAAGRAMVKQHNSQRQATRS
jgi:hypothetical protein